LLEKTFEVTITFPGKRPTPEEVRKILESSAMQNLIQAEVEKVAPNAVVTVGELLITSRAGLTDKVSIPDC